MEYTNTKEKILMNSLMLFAKSGFDGVTVRDIAAEVGIKESSLYKHYKSKTDILDHIFEELAKRCRLAMAGLVNIDSNDFKLSRETGEQDMVWVCTGVFYYFLNDEYISHFRRLLSLEQYKNKAAASLYKELFLDTPIQLYSGMFNILLAKGLIPYASADFLALEFYSPIFLLLSRCDTGSNDVDACAVLAQHVKAFYKQYCRR